MHPSIDLDTLSRVLRGIVTGKYRFEALKAPKLVALGITTSTDVFDCDDLTEAGRKAAAEATGQIFGQGRHGAVRLTLETPTLLSSREALETLLAVPAAEMTDVANALEPLLHPCISTACVSSGPYGDACQPDRPFRLSHFTPLEGTIVA